MTVLSVLQAFVLMLGVSVDCLASGFAYGTNKIRISIAAAVIITIVSTFTVGVSLFCGKVAQHYIPHVVTVIICAGILIVLGLFKIFGDIVKKKIKHSKNKLIEVCVNPEEADFDRSKVLSFKEAFVVAVALSLDGLGVGLGVGVITSGIWNYILIIAFSVIITPAMLIGGSFIGTRVAKKSKINLSWLGGVVLIGIAIMKIFL